MTYAIPADIWWLLEIAVPDGGSTPYEYWLLWHYQYLLVRGVAE